MISRIIRNVLTYIVALLLLSSCLNNADYDKTIVASREPVELNVQNIKGTWETFFWTKLVIDVAANASTSYRFTETDGFTVTFFDNGEANSGKFQEHNVFGDEIVTGTYTLRKKDDKSSKIDEIFFEYKSVKTNEDTTATTHIPQLFRESYAAYDKYHGTADGDQYKVEDIRYYRHKERAPYYQSPDKELKKQILDLDLVLGRWELYDYAKRINHQWFLPGDDGARSLGEQYLFIIAKNGRQEFYEYASPTATVPERGGDFRITDDVINIKINEKNSETGKFEIKSYKLWIDRHQIGGAPGGLDMMYAYDLYRNITSVKTEVEEQAHYKKVGTE